MHLRSLYGGTEFGIVSDIDIDEKEDENWRWHRFAKESDARWVPQGDGTSELQLLVSTSLVLQKLISFCHLCRIRRNMSYRSSTSRWTVFLGMRPLMFLPRIQQKPIYGRCKVLNLWSFRSQTNHFHSVGRADDVIIHSSGEKTVPHPFEFAVMRSPL